MDISLQTMIFLPIGLGLLGYIELCITGDHLLFLNIQNARSRSEKLDAVLAIPATRSPVAGSFGSPIACDPKILIGIQSRVCLIDLVFFAFGSCSIWFGAFVDPANGPVL